MIQVHWDSQETGGHQDHQALAHLGIQAQKACKVFQVAQEHLELQVLKAHQVKQYLNLVHLVLQGPQVNLAHWVFQVTRVNLDNLVYQVSRVQKVTQEHRVLDFLVHQVEKDCQDRRVCQVLREIQEDQAAMAHRANQASQGQRVIQALEFQEHQVLLVLQGMMGCRDLKVIWDSLDHQVNQVAQEQMAH